MRLLIAAYILGFVCLCVCQTLNRQDFRSTSAKVLAYMTCLDYVIHPDEYDKGSLSKIMAFVSTMGMSQADLPQELRNKMQPESKPAAKAAAKAKSGGKRKPKAAPAPGPSAEHDGSGEDQEAPSKRRKAEASKKKRKHSK